MSKCFSSNKLEHLFSYMVFKNVSTKTLFTLFIIIIIKHCLCFFPLNFFVSLFFFMLLVSERSENIQKLSKVVLKMFAKLSNGMFS